MIGGGIALYSKGLAVEYPIVVTVEVYIPTYRCMLMGLLSSLY